MGESKRHREGSWLDGGGWDGTFMKSKNDTIVEKHSASGVGKGLPTFQNPTQGIILSYLYTGKQGYSARTIREGDDFHAFMMLALQNDRTKSIILTKPCWWRDTRAKPRKMHCLPNNMFSGYVQSNLATQCRSSLLCTPISSNV
jgi:hypothetical protein